MRRARSKSEAVQDISSGNIDEFAQQLLEKDFKVFDEEEGPEPDTQPSALPKIDEEMVEDQIESRPELKEDGKAGSLLKAEKEQLGQALKLLKVINYLCTHQDLISERGIRLLMKGGTEAEDQGSTTLTEKEAK